MSGHVQLDGRPYLLKSPQAYRRYPANQMAPKLGQGQSQYRDLTSWEAWIVENWQAGIGQRAEDEGMRYSEADSRVPNQIILPPQLRMADTQDQATSGVQNEADFSNTHGRYVPANIASELTVGTAAVQQVSIYLNVTGAQTAVWLYLSTRSEVTVEIYDADASFLPTGAALATGTIAAASEDYAYRWYKCTLAYTYAADRCIVVRPSVAGQSFTLGCGPDYGAGITAGYTGVYDGSSWSQNTEDRPAFFTDVVTLNSKATIADMARFNGVTYLAAGTRLYKWSVNDLNWTAVGAARSTSITDLEVVGSTLYIGLGDSTNFDTMNTSEVYSNGASAGRLFYNAGTYVWKAVGSNIYYSSDGSAWSDAIPVGNAAFSVRGFAEADGELYAATDDGLYMIAPGDIAVGITPWGAPETNNGKDFLTHQGIMYACVAGQFLQINGGAVRNLWTLRKDELPAYAAGKVVGACATLNWPVVIVQPDSAAGFGGVYAWQDQGWHHLALLPQGLTPSMVRYDRATQALWVGTSNGLTFYFYLSNYLINPYEDAAARFQNFAWFETDWFSAGILESQKDIESLYLRCRNMGTGQSIRAYWQDDSSEVITYLGDEDGNYVGDENSDYVGDNVTQWSYLGEYLVDREEKRWVLGTNRPNTKEIKLGFLLVTDDATLTPKLEGHRLKYHVMIQDWWAWDLPLEVSGRSNQYQDMLDGTVQEYTATQQIAHLDSLVKGYVPPFIFTDLDGTRYEVKVKQASFSPEKVEYFDGALQFYGVYNVQLEAVHSEPYDG